MNVAGNLTKSRSQASDGKEFFPKMKLRIFTENLSKNIPSFRFPLKLSALTLPHTSYYLPFYFDKSHILSYRVQGFSRDFFLHREQGQYFIGYDLGIKQHLYLSSNSFVNFKRFSSFGRLAFNKSTMIHFFRSLNHTFIAYAPFRFFKGGSFIKTSYNFNHSNWNLDVFSEIFKKRFCFTRKVRVQNEDLDLIISGTQFSWNPTFSQSPAPSTFCFLMPTRYNSFIISSYTATRRVAFPYRFFRYFHKYFIKRNYWSFNLLRFWNQFKCLDSNSSFYLSLDNFFSMTNKKLLFFLCLKLLVLLFFTCSKVFRQLFLYPLARFFWQGLLLQCSPLFIAFYNALLNSSHWLYRDCFLLKQNPRIVYACNHVKHLSNKLFSLNLPQRNYLVVNLGHGLNILCQHGYYRPWVKRFIFSVKNLHFFKIFPKANVLVKRNAIGHPRLRKDIHRYNWSIFNPLGKLQTMIFKWFRKFLLIFLYNQATLHNGFLNKFSVLLARFFKFTRGVFPSGKSYANMLFYNKRFTKPFARYIFNKNNKKRASVKASSFFHSFSQRLVWKILKKRKKNQSFSMQIKKYQLMFLQSKYYYWKRFFPFFNFSLHRFINNSSAVKNQLLFNWHNVFPDLPTVANGIFPIIKWTASRHLSNFNLGFAAFSRFCQINFLSHFPQVAFVKQLINQFLNKAQGQFLPFKRRRSTPYVIYTALRLVFHALEAPNSIVKSWWNSFSTHHQLSYQFNQHFFSSLSVSFVLNENQRLWGNFWTALLIAYKLRTIFFLTKCPIAYDYNFVFPISYSRALFRVRARRSIFFKKRYYWFILFFKLSLLSYNKGRGLNVLSPNKSLLFFIRKNSKKIKILSQIWLKQELMRKYQKKKVAKIIDMEVGLKDLPKKGYQELLQEALNYLKNREGKKKYYEKGLQKTLPSIHPKNNLKHKQASQTNCDVLAPTGVPKPAFSKLEQFRASQAKRY